MTDEHRPGGPDVVEQADEVGRQRMDVVVGDRVRTRRAAVPALVGGEHVVARVGQHRDLVPPRVSELRKPVGQQQDGAAGSTRLGNL